RRIVSRRIRAFSPWKRVASQITTEMRNSATPPRMSTPKNIKEFATAIARSPLLESMFEYGTDREALRAQAARDRPRPIRPGGGRHLDPVAPGIEPDQGGRPEAPQSPLER